MHPDETYDSLMTYEMYHFRTRYFTFYFGGFLTNKSLALLFQRQPEKRNYHLVILNGYVSFVKSRTEKNKVTKRKERALACLQLCMRLK